MADDVVVMYAGRPVEHASVGDLFKNPKHPYTKGLLNSVPSIYERKDRLEAIAGQPADLTGGFTGCPFAPRCPKAFDKCVEDPPEFHLPGDRMSNCWLVADESKTSSHRHEAAGAAK